MNDSPSPLRFVHSFPRVSTSIASADPGKAGIEQLRSIFSNGIILTPENLDFPVDHENSMYDCPPETSVVQRRASFGLLAVKDAMLDEKRSNLFGKFAIGLDTQAARRLGMLPTIYYYAAECGTDQTLAGNKGVSHELLFRLAEIRRLLIAIAWLEAGAAESDDEYFSKEKLTYYDYVLNDEPNVWPAIQNVKRRHAARLHALLDTDRPPATALIGCLDLVLSLFQTADSSYERRHLDYYSQREWRIVAADTAGLLCIPFSAAHEKINSARMIFEFCRRFTGSTIELDDAFLLVSSDGVPFSSFISDVIVPLEKENDAQQVLGREFIRSFEGGGCVQYERLGGQGDGFRQ
ncbi:MULTISPECIES: hypothetical protein [unclassified Sulfitobacter]|nr:MULTISPECIES: hypothetical protein [unclassified Sulfitobacter]MDF3489642.1 hypothetical protein [Sulfitobacter sp. M60]MDF3493547.1 hypothetical protein [Sulfitobacter sp. M51]MDF3501356.1 hypothetical protein [Sulfitobacter sp. Ks17]MDF3528653.1 hypothetical protein [Sulfitobacter sp. M77]MDF3432958.1 hypothetical protein [Sulfitobacter sp. KE42]